MRDLEYYGKKCMEILDALEIPYTAPEEWIVNRRATRRYGQCRYHFGVYTINITYRLLDERIPEEYLEDTIIHELIHTCPGCMNHGKLFHKYCDLVNDCYSCYHISTYVDTWVSEKVEKIYPEKNRAYKYIVHCPDCGCETYYKRITKAVKNISHYHCGRCKSHNLWVEDLTA